MKIWNTLHNLNRNYELKTICPSVVVGVISNKQNKVVKDWEKYISSGNRFVVHKTNFKRFFRPVFANIAEIQYQELVANH